MVPIFLNPWVTGVCLRGAVEVQENDHEGACRVRLRVMSFNLRQNNPRDNENAWPHRKRLVANLIDRLEPDVLGIQEGFFDMLRELSELLPEYEWIGEGRRGGVEDEFSAIVYRSARLQPVTAGRFWLSHQPDVPGSQVPQTGLPRMCTWVRFRERGASQEVLCYNTHLDHRNQVAREIGAELILGHMIQHWQDYPLPTILTGDMNAPPDNPAIAAFQRTGPDGAPLLYSSYADKEQREEAVGATFHGFSGEREGEPIDYIFHSRHWSVEQVRVETESVEGRFPSDHFPVWADLSF